MQALAVLLLATLSICSSPQGTKGAGIMLGGHQEVNDADRSKEVAAFAAKALSSKADVSASGDLEVVEIVSHHSQVVAGMNHKMVFTAKDTGGKEFKFDTVVYEPLTGDWQLTKYDVVGMKTTALWAVQTPEADTARQLSAKVTTLPASLQQHVPRAAVPEVSGTSE